MTAKTTLAKAKPIVQPDTALLDSVTALTAKFDQMLRLMDEQVHLQKVALLEPGNILRFNAPDMQKIAMALPDAQDDYVQRVILRTRGFYEAKLLATVHGLGLVGRESVVCDVGANIGNHTVYFSRIMKAAKVLAFEPQQHCYDTLCANIALNGLEKTAIAHHSLIGANIGNGRMAHFNARNLGGTAFVEAELGDIPIFALDDVISSKDAAKLDLIKIDVEGMQMAVLSGAKGLLSKRKPALWVELLQRDNVFDETAEYLAQFGYSSDRIGPNDYLFQA